VRKGGKRGEREGKKHHLDSGTPAAERDRFKHLRKNKHKKTGRKREKGCSCQRSLPGEGDPTDEQGKEETNKGSGTATGEGPSITKMSPMQTEK